MLALARANNLLARTTESPAFTLFRRDKLARSGAVSERFKAAFCEGPSRGLVFKQRSNWNASSRNAAMCFDNTLALCGRAETVQEDVKGILRWKMK